MTKWETTSFSHTSISMRCIMPKNHPKVAQKARTNVQATADFLFWSFWRRTASVTTNIHTNAHVYSNHQLMSLLHDSSYMTTKQLHSIILTCSCLSVRIIVTATDSSYMRTKQLHPIILTCSCLSVRIIVTATKAATCSIWRRSVTSMETSNLK